MRESASARTEARGLPCDRDGGSGASPAKPPAEHGDYGICRRTRKLASRCPMCQPTMAILAADLILMLAMVLCLGIGVSAAALSLRGC